MVAASEEEEEEERFTYELPAKCDVKRAEREE